MEYLIIVAIFVLIGVFFFIGKNIIGSKDKEDFSIDFGIMKFTETKRNCSM